MKILTKILPACIAVFIISNIAYAADDASLLKMLDDAMAQEEQKLVDVDNSFTAQMSRNLDLSARLRGYHYHDDVGNLNTPPDNMNLDHKLYYNEIKIDFATAYEADALRLATSGWLETGNQEDTYDSVGFWQDKDLQRNYLEFNELYMTVSTESIKVTAGKQIINNKTSIFYSPTDLYSSYDINDPLDSRKLGTWQLALEGSSKDVSWKAALLPVFQPPKTPAASSRWISGGAGDFDISNFYSSSFGSEEQYYSDVMETLYFFSSSLFGGSGSFDQWINDILLANYSLVLAQPPGVLVEYDIPKPGRAESTGVFGQMQTTVGEWDLKGSVYHGPALYPVLRASFDSVDPTLTLTATHPQTNQITGGFSTVVNEFVLHGEGIYSSSVGGKDDSYIQYVMGFRWTNQSLARKFGLTRIDWGLEYAGEKITHDQDAQDYVMSSREFRLGRNNLTQGLGLHISENLRLQYLLDLELSKNSRLNRLNLEWNVTEKFIVDMAIEAFDGPQDSYYGYWKNQDRIIMSLKYQFK